MSDEYYIDKVLQGDPNAYGFLVNKYKDLVFTLVLKMIRNREDAEEIAQDTFIKAYYSLNTFKRKSKLSTWLFRIAYNTSISKLRKHNPVKGELPLETIPDSADVSETDEFRGLSAEEQQDVINKSLEKLSPEESFMVTLYYYEDCSLDDISKITGQPAANAKVKLHRIRRKMQVYMQEIMPALAH